MALAVALHPSDYLVLHLGAVPLKPEEEQHIRNGQAVPLSQAPTTLSIWRFAGHTTPTDALWL